MSFQPKFKVSTLFDFVPKQRQPSDSALFESIITFNKTRSLKNNYNLTTKRIAFDTKSIEWFMIKLSISFLKHVHNIAFEEVLF